MTDRSIIVGVDGTSTALRAVAWAAKEALLRGRPLRLVHAAPYLGTPDDPTGRGRADAVLARARTVAHQIAPELSTDVAVLPDPPVSALIDASADAELLVIGMIGGSGAEIVLGSVTLDITTGAHCPVAVVRGESAADHATRRRPPPVLLGIESVDADAAAVTAAFDDADRHGSGLTVVQVPNQPGHLGLAASAVSDRLAPWRSEHPGVEVTVADRTGQPGPRVAARVRRCPTHRAGHPRPPCRGARRARLGEPFRAPPQPRSGHDRSPLAVQPDHRACCAGRRPARSLPTLVMVAMTAPATPRVRRTASRPGHLVVNASVVPPWVEGWVRSQWPDRGRPPRRRRSLIASGAGDSVLIPLRRTSCGPLRPRVSPPCAACPTTRLCSLTRSTLPRT